MKKACLLIVWILFFTSCEKNIDFKLEESAPKLVVEATIENGEAPRVILTRSLNYFSKIDPAMLTNSFVRNATVEIYNGQRNHRLKEYALPLAPGINLYYYSIDSSQLSTAFVGELNKTYQLRIVTNNQEYTAQTTIPNITKRVDSIWWKPVPRDTAGKVVVLARVADPAGLGDYIRYWTKRNDQPFYPGYTSVYDDVVIDGTTYEIEIEPGVNRNEGFSDEEREFRRGDTITFKLSNIDRATYDFWRTMEYSYASVGNPFSSPVKVLSNISGEALGYFGGYATQYHRIIIPR